MLHTRVQGDHRQVVRVHNVVDIAGQAEGELGHRHQKGVAAAGCCALDVHGRAAGGLTQSAADIQTQLAETFDQAQGNGGFALAEGGRGDGSDFDELAVGLILQTLHDLDEVDLRGLAVGDDLLGQQAELFPEVVDGGKILLRLFCDLPILVDRRVERDAAGLRVYILAVLEFDCHIIVSSLQARGLNYPVAWYFSALCGPVSARSVRACNRYCFIGYEKSLPRTTPEVNHSKPERTWKKARKFHIIIVIFAILEI